MKCYEQIDVKFSNDSYDKNRLYHVFTLAAVIYTTVNDASTAGKYIDKLESLNLEKGPVVDTSLSNDINRLKLYLKAKSVPVEEEVSRESTKCPVIVKNKVEGKSFVSTSLEIFNLSIHRVDSYLCIVFTIIILVIAIIIKFMLE